MFNFWLFFENLLKENKLFTLPYGVNKNTATIEVQLEILNKIQKKNK